MGYIKEKCKFFNDLMNISKKGNKKHEFAIILVKSSFWSKNSFIVDV